ncbi:MAG: hypothetical protein E7277_08955 [Lachnospiraceae bacterium]|jgi:cytidyltransferase-like protein|nr:hypothetical protein [Lachnospiraceae bacterium]
MAEKKGRNAVYVGSFNPIHVGHIETMKYGLEHFEYLNMFVRYNDGVDLTDWDTKQMFFEMVAKDLGATDRVRIFKEESEEKGKSYAIELFYDFIRKTEQVIGEKVDGFLFGSDYEKILPLLQKEFPDMQFIILDRSEGYSSTAIREDLEGHKDWLPPYVYETLKKLQ